MRTGADQASPSVLVLSSRSPALFGLIAAVQPASNRQSAHVTYTLPCASISAEGKAGPRRSPVGGWYRVSETITDLFQLAPPFVDMNDLTKYEVSEKPSKGTITVPFGWTTGWPPESADLVRRGLPRAPGQSAVGGRAHLLQITEVDVVELGVAVTVERTGRGVVGDAPVLVEEIARGRDSDRGAPRVPAVGRAADQHVDSARVAGRDGEIGNQPNPTLGVVGNRRIADREVHPRRPRIDRCPGQETVGEGVSRVVRDGKSDVGGSAAEDSPRLENRDPGPTPGERVWLDLGLVLTGRTSEWVATYL